MERGSAINRIKLLLFVLVAITGTGLFVPGVRNYFFEQGLRAIYVCSMSFCLCFCLTPAARLIARKVGALDIPNSRKVHQEATPLLGGGAIFLGFILAIFMNGIFSQELFAILIASAVLFVVGIIDDIREISAGIKILIQVLVTVFIIWKGIILYVIPDAFGFAATVGNIVLTFFWIVGITNAMNFFDGMDGLAAGLGAIISFFLGVVAFQTYQPFLGWISIAMMGSCIGFLPYNFRINGRATIFLGDAGSTLIGFILACVAVYGDWAEGSALGSLAPPLLIFWVLIFDMVHISVERIVTGKVATFRQWLEYVGKDHLHHRLAVALGGAHRSVLFIFLLNFCLGTGAVVLRDARPIDALLLVGQAVGLVLLVTFLERRGRNIAEESLNQRADN